VLSFTVFSLKKPRKINLNGFAFYTKPSSSVECLDVSVRLDMAILHDPPIVRPYCHGKSKHAPKQSSAKKEALGNGQRRFLPKSMSLPSLSSVIKSSLTWAGDTWYNAHQDDSSKVEKGGHTDRDDRKKVLYLRMRNVCPTLPPPNTKINFRRFIP
jgi:hypothetical protein